MRAVDKGLTRKGHHPRDPRVPTSGEPTSTIRIASKPTTKSPNTAKGPTNVDSEAQVGQDDVHASANQEAPDPGAAGSGSQDRDPPPAAGAIVPAEPQSAEQDGRSWSELSSILDP